MASLQTLDIKSNEVPPHRFRVSSTLLLDGTSALLRSKPMKIARRLAPFTKRIQHFVMIRLAHCKLATTIERNNFP